LTGTLPSSVFKLSFSYKFGIDDQICHCFHYSSRPRSEQSLVRWATPQLHDIDALDRMVDPALKGLYPAKSLSRFADVLALCVQVAVPFIIHAG
jgi:hypothetical protein